MKQLFVFLEGNCEKILAVFFLCAMIVLLTAIVFSRFVLQRGLSFAEELERMAFVWFVYLSAAYAARQGTHIRMEAQLQLLKEKSWKILRILADGIWVWFNFIIIREGVKLVHSMIVYPYESPALGWSMAYVYTLVPISFALISLRVIQHIWRELKALKHWGNS